MKKIGFSAWLYMIGFFGAIILGLLEGAGIDFLVGATWVIWVLITTGLLIGVFNVTASETQGVLLAALVIGSAGGIISVLPGVGGIIDAVLTKVALLSLSVAIPPAFKELQKKLS